MELIEDGFLAFFSALGIAWLIWSAARLLFLRRIEHRERCVALIAASGDAPALEETVEALRRVHIGGGCGFSEIIIADCGMYEQAYARSRLIEHGDGRVTVCGAGEIRDRLI